MLSVIISIYFGLKGVFIDLYNPGSPVARYYSDIVNWISIGTVIIAIPLLIEKYRKIKEWYNKINWMDDEERQEEFGKAAWSIMKPIVIALALAVVFSIIISAYWEIPADVMFNYTNYYSGNVHAFNSPEFLNMTKDINITTNNNYSSIAEYK